MKLYCSIVAFLLFLLMASCQNKDVLFSTVPPESSGITFNNVIQFNDSVNILKYEYIYNGGGVVIADFNLDSLQDILFTGNMVDNALYLNKGNFNFEDVSVPSGIAPSERWSTGATIADVNLDGLLDVFITASGHDYIENRSNQLFICQRISPEGIPVFKDESLAYGLLDSSYSTHAAFIDIDNDQDLDLFVINNHMVEDRLPSKYKDRLDDKTTPRTDKLYRNDWNDTLGHPVFVDISEEAGILIEGFSLGVNIHDFNQDGWDDIYITNDYLTNDLLYINQRNGRFKNEADRYFKHTSFSAMGNDVVDFDNDGHAEVVALDMLPKDNYRKKTMLPANNYTSYINNERYNYQYQHVRNTLQKNNFNPEMVGDVAIFSERALIAGVAATDWSWAPLVADFDNDGDRDMIVTNGFPQDITDRDFIDYNLDVGGYASDEYLLSVVPSIKILNVAYENEGNLNFRDVTKKWGITKPTFSNGAAFGDLDNDGDLDYVVNNINDVATLYRNDGKRENHWIRIQLSGPETNPYALGSKIKIFVGDQVHFADYTTVHGYLSSVEPIAHFGLGTTEKIDSVHIIWPGNQLSVIYNLKIDALNKFDYNNLPKQQRIVKINNSSALLIDVTAERNLKFTHPELDYNDFNVQPMLLHKLSQYGPGVAVGDVTGDDLEDLYIPGSHFYSGTFFIQKVDGTFAEKQLITDTIGKAPGEELGALIFDADNDGDNDLYVVHGGNEFRMEDSIYQDRLYINNGINLEYYPEGLPSMPASGSIVRAHDFDHDGDLDLFVGGRVSPQDYPNPGRSFLLRNDSRPGNVSFTDVTVDLAPELQDAGMITDAIWTDYNNDDQTDLIVTGEFMPVTLFKNENGTFKNETGRSGLAAYSGWWNSIIGRDFDSDGDIDYIAGNYGSHSLTEISDKHPIKVYYKDFDQNGTKDLIPTCWFEDQAGQKKEFPYFGRLEYQKQVNKIKATFRKHGEFANASINEILSQEDLEDCLELTANYMYSSLIRNMGDGTFEVVSLDPEVQVAPVYGMQASDVNGDGFDDVLIIGNDYGMEVSIGRLTAHDGLILLGKGNGQFEVLPASKSGFYVQGDGKSLTKLYNKKNNSLDFIALENRGPLKAYTVGKDQEVFAFNHDDKYALFSFNDGRMQKLEHTIGGSYLAQSTNYHLIPKGVSKIEIVSMNGSTRTISLEDPGKLN